MAFWADPSVEPKRAFRWLLYLNTGTIPAWLITKVTQPGFKISEKEHQFLNHKFYYPGRVEWTEVKFTLVDAISPDGTQLLMELLGKSGYIYPDGVSTTGATSEGTDTISKGRATTATPDMTIQLIGPGTGDVTGLGAPSNALPIGKWTMKNAWIRDVAFSELSYESDDLLNAEVTVRYDWAVYEGEPAVAVA